MKHFTIPPPIQLKDRKTGKPYKVANETRNGEQDIPALSFCDWLNDYPLNDKRFAPSSGFHAVMSGGKVQVATKDIPAGAGAALEDDDWERLKESIENPEQVAGIPMTPEMGRQYYIFSTTILEATDKAVQEVKEETV